MAVVRASVLGHSFVKRLGDYTRDGEDLWKNLRLNNDEFDIEFVGLGGSNVHTVQQKLGEISRFSPQLVFMQIGSNDLCKANCEPERLARHIISLANLLCEGYGVQRVVIGQILRRQPPSGRHVHKFWAHMEVSLEEYNLCVIKTNSILENSLDQCQDYSNMTYWRHRGFWNQDRNMLSDDGVHLNAAGLHKYAYSVRKALLYARDRLTL